MAAARSPGEEPGVPWWEQGRHPKLPTPEGLDYRPPDRPKSLGVQEWIDCRVTLQIVLKQSQGSWGVDLKPFSNLKVHQNHLEDLLKHRGLDLRVSDSVGLEGHSLRICVCNKLWWRSNAWFPKWGPHSWPSQFLQSAGSRVRRTGNRGWGSVCATYILDPSVHHGLRITVFKCFKTSEMSLFPTLSVTMGKWKVTSQGMFVQYH